jgi:signal transduction histidine kinase
MVQTGPSTVLEDSEYAMSNDVLFQARQNRLLARVRVVLALFSTAAIYVDPDRPGFRDDLSFYVLEAYLAASVGILLVTRYWRGGYGQVFRPTFALDFLAFAAVLYLSYGSTGSPFFLLFVFMILSATLQWGWRGAAALTAVVMAVFIPTGLALYPQTTGTSVDVARFTVRVGSMLSLAGLMIAFGRHEERIERDMLRLFGPRLRPVTSDTPPIEACLEHATTVFGLKHGLFVWGDPEEPKLTVAQLADGRLTEWDWPVVRGAPPAALDPIDEPFVFDPQGPSAFSIQGEAQMTPVPRQVLDNPILHGLATGRALVLPVKASSFAGWVVLVDPPELARESLFLGSTVAAQLSVAVEAWRSLMVWRDAAAADARVRLAQDLHDGILQFLAGTALQLEALAHDVDPAQGPHKDRIARLQDDLRTEQRQLRELIGALGPRAHQKPPAWVDLAAEMEGLAAMLRRQWSAEVAVDLDPSYRRLPARLAFELLQIIREAVSNAVRHGRAGTISINGGKAAETLALTIKDDGKGMPLMGDFDMDELNRLGLGPRSLRARIAQLGGTLLVSSTPQGSTLNITLPGASAA